MCQSEVKGVKAGLEDEGYVWGREGRKRLWSRSLLIGIKVFLDDRVAL